MNVELMHVECLLKPWVHMRALATSKFLSFADVFL